MVTFLQLCFNELLCIFYGTVNELKILWSILTFYYDLFLLNRSITFSYSFNIPRQLLTTLTHTHWLQSISQQNSILFRKVKTNFRTVSFGYWQDQHDEADYDNFNNLDPYKFLLYCPQSEPRRTPLWQTKCITMSGNLVIRWNYNLWWMCIDMRYRDLSPLHGVGYNTPQWMWTLHVLSIIFTMAESNIRTTIHGHSYWLWKRITTR